MPAADLLAADRAHVWHPYAAMPAALPPLPVVSAEGVRLRLAELPAGTVPGMARPARLTLCFDTELLEREADPARAVTLYLDRMEEPETRARVVYQRVLAQLAESLLPRIFEEERGAAGEGAAER